MDIRFVNGSAEVYTPNSNGWKAVYDLALLDNVYHVRFVNDDGHLWVYPVDEELLGLFEEDVPLDEFDYF